MAELPEDVKQVKRALSRLPSNELTEMADKLIVDTPELVSMWKKLEFSKPLHDPDWVTTFLLNAVRASSLPPYHYKSAADRRAISKEIGELASRLARALTVNGLDAHLVHNDGKLFNGFFLYEDFGDSNQARIDADDANKLKVSILIQRIAERAQQKIADEPMPGKVGANVRAIRFIRIFGASNQRCYGKPLYAVTALATNAVFGTAYIESDIHNLLNR